MNRYPQFLSAQDLNLLSRVLQQTSTIRVTESDHELQDKRFLKLFGSGSIRTPRISENQKKPAILLLGEPRCVYNPVIKIGPGI